MQLLQMIFQLLAVCGCWQPPSSATPFKKFFYTVYTVILFILLNAITFLQCLDLILVVENQDEFSDNIYLTLTMMVSCHKMCSMLPSQKNITVLINILEKKPFQPENEKEMEIRKKFDKRAHWQAFLYLAVTQSTVIFYSSTGVFKTDAMKLPYRMWLPFDYLPLYLHIIIYFLQVVTLVAGAVVHNACDALIWGLFIHTYSQLEILGARLKAIEQGNNQSAKASARYHNRVYRFARMINEEFKMIIFVQFTVSTLVVCFTLYTLVTTNDVNVTFLKIIMYSCAMLVQIFFFCWYGNEVKLKSIGISDVIFGIDWTQMNNDTKRILLMIMRRATHSIEFTSFHVVSLNLESFVNVSKCVLTRKHLLTLWKKVSTYFQTSKY
ncbi:odorant receptor 46a-like [Osmia bicornis bicornis]|uniref:odorant receptor 46a-like n=1 Tax=Osmia bicornis bicornis TaxID=1437191 RepID=UPI001EAE8C9A|nr:odorant receptor 46a-like [Osmia bicornis bicornis]